ncbi:MAG: TetR/AcrR family transcriptional regulator [Nakamurella sp.]
MNSEHPIDPSSPRRAYRSPLRSEQATATRRRLLTAAGECFAGNGYAGTSLRAIAERAGVSVETVQLNGPKADLLLAAFEQQFVGREGRESLLESDAVKPLLQLSDPAQFVQAMVGFMAGANMHSAALATAFEAAAMSDPKIAQALRELGGRARADARDAVAFAKSIGGVTSGRSIDEVGDELWFVMRPPHFLQLSQILGWTAERYQAWLLRAVQELLL